MSNITHLQLPTVAVPPVTVSVAPILRNLDMLFVAAVIGDDAYRLGYIVAAKMQNSGTYVVPMTWEEANRTAVLVDGVPHSGMHAADAETFSRSLMELQMHCGVFSHTKRPNLMRAKDRFTHFLCNIGGTRENMFELLAQDETVLMQYRPDEEESTHRCAQDAIMKRLWQCKFAHISTEAIEKVINN